jgi:phosphoribosyl 1,2-cyclic phosphate phosphodiesterase
MHIKILGSSNAEGWPALFCNCFSCQRARELGGKNIRSRSTVLIDETLKLDLPPDTFHQITQHNINFSKLKYLLITRSDYYNFAFDELKFLNTINCQRKGDDYIRVLGNTESINHTKKLSKDIHASLHEIEPYQTISLGNYVVNSLKAQNNGDLYPLNYIIKKGKKSILYATNTGFYEEKTWKHIRGEYVDMVILECSQGPKKSQDLYKMGIPDVVQYKKRAEEVGLSGSHTQWILTNFSHNGGITHEELKELATPFGFTIAFDGMECEVI